MFFPPKGSSPSPFSGGEPQSLPLLQSSSSSLPSVQRRRLTSGGIQRRSFFSPRWRRKLSTSAVLDRGSCSFLFLFFYRFQGAKTGLQRVHIGTFFSVLHFSIKKWIGRYKELAFVYLTPFNIKRESSIFPMTSFSAFDT